MKGNGFVWDAQKQSRFVVTMATTKLTLVQHPPVCLLGWLASLVSTLLCLWPWQDLSWDNKSESSEGNLLPAAHTHVHTQAPVFTPRYKTRPVCKRKRTDFCLTSSSHKRIPVQRHGFKCKIKAFHWNIFLSGRVFPAGLLSLFRGGTKSVLITCRCPLRISPRNRFLWTKSFWWIEPCEFKFIWFVHKAFALKLILYLSRWC